MGDVIHLPIVKIERFEPLPSHVTAMMAGKRGETARGLAKSSGRRLSGRKLQKRMEAHACTIETCLAWLSELAAANPDPSVIAGMVGELFEDCHDIPAALEWMDRFRVAWGELTVRRTTNAVDGEL